MVYLLENVFALFIFYAVAKIGERYNYAVVMCIGIVPFIILQVVLNHPVYDGFFVVLLSFLYSLYSQELRTAYSGEKLLFRSKPDAHKLYGLSLLIYNVRNKRRRFIVKVFVAASSSFWDRLPEVKKRLEKLGHEVRLPSSVHDPEIEERCRGCLYYN